MNENKSFNKNPANHALYHALIEALIEDENAMDKGVADTIKNHKRQRDDDKDDYEDPSAGPNQGKKTKRGRTNKSESSMKPSTTKETSKGKAPSKSSKTGKSATTKELIEEPIAEVAMDDLETNANEDVVNDADRPQDDVAPKTNKPSRDTWFKQPPRPPTPDPEWNKLQVVTDQPEQPWFNRMVSATKDPLTFNELMATLIDFSKFAMNRLKLDHITQEILIGPVYNLLKGTYLIGTIQKEIIAPFDLTKPLPLKGGPGHLTVAAEYFFNNDLEFLKSSDPGKNYTTSITKTKASRYKIAGIEDMVPMLWSPIKYGYDKDNILGVKSVSVKKLHGYGHLEEIVVKKADLQLYNFKEGDFVDLHLNDIKDMLLLVVQHKLFHLDGSDIVDFIVALRMFTRSLIIKRRVEDLQLVVESYQKKLNITEPQKTFPEIKLKKLYTPSHKPPGTVRDELHHKILDFRLGYNKEMSRRKWTATNKRRTKPMVELIDKQMRERRIIRNLVRLVGAQELEMDYKLMTRTILGVAWYKGLRGSFVSFREMITSQLQGKLWLYDESLEVEDSSDDGDEHTGSARLDHGFRMFIPHDTQSRKVKVINGSRVVLSGTRRDNCVYYLDGHAMAGELNASVEEKDSLVQVWHKRLGHISEARLQVLEKQGLFCKKSLELHDDNFGPSCFILLFTLSHQIKNPNNLPLFDDDKTNKVSYELHHKAKASSEVEM
ncbi:retrovirus-related pol polyprotein from transposon TNT 1-94 [Tanacetum coccineum]